MYTTSLTYVKTYEFILFGVLKDKLYFLLVVFPLLLLCLNFILTVFLCLFGIPFI